MANEYLQRTPTSVGNPRIWTLSYWVKKGKTGKSAGLGLAFSNLSGSAGGFQFSGAGGGGSSVNDDLVINNRNATTGVSDYVVRATQLSRDVGSWMHIMVSFNSTLGTASDRVIFYINGVRVTEYNSGDTAYPSKNYASTAFPFFRTTTPLRLAFSDADGSGNGYFEGEMCDVYAVDGLALTPDVFGFNKQGKGYISVGSAQATDFRPGQWVPKTPRVIKTEINRRGGFGVNGFYLPMNDSRNFGADFHGEPNSIITLNEKLPQPRVGVASTASVGLGYTDALRADPYAANLVLALPFVSGGLQSGLGDYSHIIRNTGTAKTFVWNAGSTTVSTAATASYYGSAGNFPGGTVGISTSTDFKMDGSFTVESWFYSTNFNSTSGNHIAQGRNGTTGEDNWVLSQGGTGAVRFLLRNDNGTNAADLSVTNSGIVVNQWYHFAGVYDDIKKTSTVYLNGVAVGINTNVNWTRNNTTTLLVGSNDSNPTGAGGNRNVNGYLQDLRIYKGVAKYTGGFDVPRPYTPVGIATWRQVPDTTANNFATLNPLGEKQSQKGTITTGNLRYDGVLNTFPEITSTVGVSTGKWYYEVYTGTVGAGGDSHFLGISNRSANSNGTLNIFPSSSSGGTRPTIGISNRFSTQLALYDQTGFSDISGTSGWWADGSVVGFAFDINNNSISVYKNGVLGFTSSVNLSYVATGIGSTVGQGVWSPCFSFESSASRTPASNWVMNFGQNPTFSGNTTAGTFTDTNGKGLFKYQPPSGFLALCEDNLPTPAISDPGKYFKTVLYTASGNGTVVGCGFTPDLVWIKNRDNIEEHHLIDSVRGTKAFLRSNSTAAEISQPVNESGTFTFGFTDNGFSINDTNTAGGELYFNNRTYVAWCWRAGAGTTSTNTNGSITSVVSVNQDAGFSIVSFTGTGAQGTFGHGLGKTPKFIVMKRRTGGTNNWSVYHSSLGLSHTTYPNWLYLSATSSEQSSVSSANHPLYQRPDSSLIYLNTGTSESTNVSGSTYITYCWAEIENFSKFGSYVGNGNADGPFVYCGFKPAWVMIKNVTDASGWFWAIGDSSRSSTNPDGAKLFANNANVEDTASYPIDYLSNGFKIRTTQGTWNLSASTHIFAAFAESPFQTANSK
jgi:hypothetical protein